MSKFVEFRHLEYLVAIAEGKNFTKAAERVYRSQPAISQQVRALEDDIEFPIFIRGGRDGIEPTEAGQLVLKWAKVVLRERFEIFKVARAIHRKEIPPLRLGFCPFVSPQLLQTFRSIYEEHFPGCEIHLSETEPLHTLQRLAHGILDCAILPMPVERDLWNVLEIAQSPLVVCMRADDPLASQSHLDIHEIASQIKVFRDPEFHPTAHSRLIEMFAEAGEALHLASSAATPSDMQWMVKENYGLALIDQRITLEPGLITRPIAGVNWTADIAFVSDKNASHIALPFIEKFLQEDGLTPGKKPTKAVGLRPQQLKLIG